MPDVGLDRVGAGVVKGLGAVSHGGSRRAGRVPPHPASDGSGRDTVLPPAPSGVFRAPKAARGPGRRHHHQRRR